MKKLLATLLASATALTAVGCLVACGGDKGPVLKVWAPGESIAAYEQLANQFKKDNSQYAKYDIKFEPVEEGVVQTSMGKDPSTGAAVFFFPSDHLYKLNKAKVLQPLTSEYVDIVKGRDEQFTYEFATVEEQLLAFPATNDNGYFLYYDSRVLSEQDVASLDTLQARAKELGKHIAFNYGDVFNAASFYIGTDCEFGYGDHTMQTYHTTLDSEAGKTATKAYLKYFDPALNNGYDSTDKVITNGILADGLAGGTYIAGVDGTWKWSTIKEKMEAKEKGSSEYIKTAVLPSFTVDGDDTTYYMGSFYGAKYCGVNRQKDKDTIRASLALAEYFTSKEGQLARYAATYSGPSNIEAAQDPTVAADPRIVTYKAQVARKGRLHRDQSGDFWSPSGFGNLMNKIATGKIKDADHPNETDEQAAFRTLKELAESMEKAAK